MTNKIHLRRNKENGIDVLAVCATNPNVAKARRNSRTSYQFMSSPIVSWEEFKTVAAADRCAHCVEAALTIRNRQRKAKGLVSVKTLFEGVC